MNQLTLRGIDKELARYIRDLARREGLPLNKAALLLMRRGAGISAIGSALDEFIGTWPAADEKRFLESIELFETVDEDLWK